MLPAASTRTGDVVEQLPSLKSAIARVAAQHALWLPKVPEMEHRRVVAVEGTILAAVKGDELLAAFIDPK